MYTLKYDSTENRMYRVDANGTEKLVIEDMASRPSFAPTNKQALFVAPVVWGERSDLYTFDLHTGEKEKIQLPIKENLSPSRVVYLTDTVVAMILETYQNDEVVGGDIYVYDLKQKTIRKALDLQKEKKQAIMLHAHRDMLFFEGMEFTNFEKKEFVHFKDSVSMEFIHTDGKKMNLSNMNSVIFEELDFVFLHDGEEKREEIQKDSMLYVVKGDLQVEINEKSYTLSSKDCMSLHKKDNVTITGYGVFLLAEQHIVQK